MPRGKVIVQHYEGTKTDDESLGGERIHLWADTVWSNNDYTSGYLNRNWPQHIYRLIEVISDVNITQAQSTEPEPAA